VVQGAPIIRTKRAVLRPLVEADVGQSYLNWFSDPEVARFIEAARVPQSAESLRCFVRCRAGHPDVSSFRVVSAETNGSWAPTSVIHAQDRLAAMSIMIGATDWCGVGLAGGLMPAVVLTLHEFLGVRNVDRGVNRENLRAYRAYERTGFRDLGETSSGIRICLDIATLVDAAGGLNAAT